MLSPVLWLMTFDVTIFSRILLSSPQPFLPQLIDDRITFVDAKLRTYTLDLVGISSWEVSQAWLQFLLDQAKNSAGAPRVSSTKMAGS